MKTKQLVVRSAVTVVATGLTLLSSGNSQASGRGSSGMRMGGSRGGMHNGAIHQGISSRAIARAQGANTMIGRTGSKNATLNCGRDDRGHGRHERGADRGGARPSLGANAKEVTIMAAIANVVTTRAATPMLLVASANLATITVDAGSRAR